jgi:hypothetical protein
MRSSHREQDRNCFATLMQTMHPKNAGASEFRNSEPQMPRGQFVCQHAELAFSLPSHRVKPLQLDYCARCLFLRDQVDSCTFPFQPPNRIAPVRAHLLRYVRHSFFTLKRERQARISRFAHTNGILDPDV